MRTARAARIIWKKMKMPFLSEMIAESMWKAMTWACDTRSHAVFQSLRHAYSWSSTAWWRNTKALNMMINTRQSRDGSTTGAGTIEDVCGTR